ncbi:hypothetical protein PCASD_13865 [Puccinia coronata f. sp. avenae]|uniref:Uncharacterized protein n=1 Tax=Puccinia coronata f. sp. avenae TaxID=200324 RepID=A0A2N5U841_9BASI|nr:hypothetical protein PCASD_13865 [Puccinia coronata f. sp. avenae]
MAGWPLLTNGQLFSLLMLAQFMIHFTIEGAPVHPPPVSAAGNSVFPECYSVVQTAQPALYSVLTPNVVPVAYAVHWSQEFHPGTLITNHLVPNTQQTPPHNIDPGSALRSDAIPYEPQEPKKQIYKKQDPARVKNAAAQKTRASGQVNARTASRAFVPVGRSPVGNVPSALGVKTNLPVPVSSSKVAPLTDGERSEKMSKESCFPSPRNIEQSGIEKQSEPPIYATQKRTEQNEFCQILAQAGILLPETKIQHTHDSVLREEKDATTRIHNYGILNQNSANIPPRADLNSVHDTAETKPNSAKKNVREYGMESPVGLPTASVAVLPSTQRDDFKDVVGASKEIKSEDLKKPETSLEKTAGVPQSPRADALPSTATVELDVIPSSDTHRLKDDVHGPKSSLNIMRDQKISSASLKSGGDVLSPVSVGKIPAASAQRKSSSDVKTSDSTTNRKGIPQSKREEVLSSSNTIRDQNIEVGKKRSPDSSIMQTPTKPTAKGGDEGVGGDLATPRAEDRNKIAPKINLKSPTLNPVENEIRLATPVESYKSTLLKNFSPSDVGDRAEGMKESVEQMGPSLPAHAISDSERKPTKKNLNDPVYLKNDEAKNGTPLTFKNPSDSVPRTVQPSDQLSASTETTSRISKGNNVFKETPMISGTNKFGSDVGVMISKKKAQLNHSHSKKFPWEILSSDLESHTDSTFSDSENFTEEVPADENSSPEKLKEEPQNDSQYDTKDSQEVEIMEKESRPRKSSGERKKKSKKLKKAQPETVKNTWGSTKDDEENVGKRNGKSQMTNPEKLKKGYEEKQGIGSRQVASEVSPYKEF